MIFKHWSLKRLLRVWALTTIIAVLAMAIAALYSNLHHSKSQQQLVDQVLPLEDSSRQLAAMVSAFTLRQQQMFNSSSRDELLQLRQREQLEAAFDQHWLALTGTDAVLADDTARMGALYELYQQFLLLDGQLWQQMGSAHQLSADLRTQSAAINDLQLQLQQNTEVLTALLPNGSVAAQQLSLSALLLSGHLRGLQYSDSSSEALQQSVAGFEQQQTQLAAQIGALLTAGHDSRSMTTLESLHAVSERLRQRVVSGDFSLMQLRKQQLNNQQQLQQLQQQGTQLLNAINEQLTQLSLQINQHSIDTLDRSQTVAKLGRSVVLGLAALMILGMIGFVVSITARVYQPLLRLRQAMHALSSENFDTRLPPAAESPEFELLARDFNQFAENTQTLIHALADAKQSLLLREQHIRAILNGVPEAILTLSHEAVITACNPAAERILQASEQDLVGEHLSRFLSGRTAQLSPEQLYRLQQQHKEFEGFDYNGDAISIWLSLSPVSSLDGDLWVCVISDITSWNETRKQLQQRTSELDAILENAMVGIAFIKDRHLIRVNHKFEQLFGCSREQIEGESAMYLHPSLEAFDQFGDNAYTALARGEDYEAQVEMVRLSGEPFWCAVAGKAVDPDNPAEGSIWLFEDVTKQRRDEERLTRLASVDVLTGLPNRAVFNDRLEHAIHKAHRNSGRLAVFFVDLDHFKHINDSLGHKVGDMLLSAVAKRIRSCVREDDTVARLGGDEFTVILEDVRSAQYVGKVAEKILNTAALPYQLDGTEVNISPSIGISLYPADGRDMDMLIRNADAAMYHAKNNGRNNFQFYSADMNAEAAQRLALETSLRRAVEQDEFYLHFQPQIDLDTGEAAGAEVLLRWHTEQWGEVSPARFVPILEDTGLINAVGEWVLRETCRQFMSMREHLPETFVMAVNLSGRQFKGGQLVRYIEQLLYETGMPAANLELEITESLLMDDTALAIATLRELSALGVTLAIDDFGTGYSSLSYLKQFPLNVLKIDRTFVSDVTDDKDDAAIVNAIIAMSRSLDLQVVAEGVETVEQLEFLQAHDCKRAQGYLFSRPIPAIELMRYLHRERQRA